MISNLFVLFVAPDDLAADRGKTAEAEAFTGWMLARAREMFCGVRGHENLMQFERERLFLRCLSCGRETPGWELNEAPPRAAIGHPVIVQSSRRLLSVGRPC
jgi:hypothetical protein